MLNVLDDRVQVLAVSVDEGGLSNDGGMLTLSVCDEDGRNLCCAPIKSRQPVLQLHARPASRLAAVPDMDDALDMVTDCIERHTDVIIVTVYDSLDLLERLCHGQGLRIDHFKAFPDGVHVACNDRASFLLRCLLHAREHLFEGLRLRRGIALGDASLQQRVHSISGLFVELQAPA